MANDEKKIKYLSTYYSILSEESRLKIIKSIKNEEKSVSEIIKETGLSQANVSKHLKLMLVNNVVRMKVSGPNRFYKMDNDMVSDILKLCEDLYDEREKTTEIPLF